MNTMMRKAIRGHMENNPALEKLLPFTFMLSTFRGLRAFAVAGPSCWNELPVELRDLTVSPVTFAKHLKTHLFRVVFF